MAKRITREADAKRALLPEGWDWADESSHPKLAATRFPGESGSWLWGVLVRKPANGLTQYASQYKALTEMIASHQVFYKIYNWNKSSTGRHPTGVQIRPIRAEELAARAMGREGPDTTYTRLMQDGMGELNLLGWTTTDGTVIPPGEFLRDGNVLNCHSCKIIRPNLVTDPNTSTLHCRNCIRVCPGSGTTTCNVPVFDQNFHGCEMHFPRASCYNCSTVYELTNYMGEHQGHIYCRECLNTICDRCGLVGAFNPHTETSIPDGRYESYTVCKDCRKEVVDWIAQDRNEQIVLEKTCNMQLSSVPQRPIRLASVELEIAAGAEGVLRSLNRAGLTRASELARYHTGDDTDFCYMEYDGSLAATGGELIFPKMRLDSADTVRRLSEAIGHVRKAVKDGNASVDLSTGMHVHIDAHKLGFSHIRNLVLLFNYLEDPIYRLSAANYARHRGVHYAIVLPKTGHDSQADFNRSFFRGNQHHSVLNVAYFYSAVGNSCECGNIVAGNPELCECKLGKCTVEFRVFNGTSSWKKIHAYLALCMSMVAYASQMGEAVVEDFPPCLYRPVGRIDASVKESWNDRLTWMFRNLWFSEEERASILYCIEHSELSKLSYADRRALREVAYKGRKYIPSKAPKKTEEPPVSPFQNHQPNLGRIREGRLAYARAAQPSLAPMWTTIYGSSPFIAVTEDGR